MAQQNGEQGDGVFVEKLTNHLFENSVGDKASAMDLIALNIQRGRDHGVPGAFKWKKIMFFVIPEMPSKTFVML